MAENSKIEWTDHTFNPWTGCTKVSPGCDHCYAEGWAKRSGTVRWGVGEPRRRTTEANWRLPLKWNAQAEREGRRFRVFCSSLADVFDNAAPPEWRADLLHLIVDTPHLDWLLLTKRIGNAHEMLQEAAARNSMPRWDGWHNVWLGATVVNQAEADRDIPKLLKVPARVRFLSIEPMLGPIDLQRGCTAACRNGGTCSSVKGTLNERCIIDSSEGGIVVECICSRLHGLHWVICGGESGPGARPMHPEWARSLRDQCQAAGVPFLFKQWGEWIPGETEASADGYRIAYPDEVCSAELGDGRRYAVMTAHQREFLRVGKKLAGRLLDGVQHDGFQEVA